MTEQPETPEAADEAPAGQEPVGQTPLSASESEPTTAVTPPEPATVVTDTGATAVTEPAAAESESESTPATPEPAAAHVPAAASPPPPRPGPASTQSAGFDSVDGGQEEGLLVQRPEIAVGAAFAGGLVLALLLKRLAR